MSTTSAQRQGDGISATLPRQTDATTCGIAAVAAVAARARRLSVPRSMSGGTGEEGGAGLYLDAGDDRIARVQRDLHRIAARTGIPWPQSLGTSPWALATLARRATGERYRILPWIGPWAGSTSRAVDLAVEAGLDAFAYSGSRLIPRHVVAILGQESEESGGETYAVFEPSSGAVLRVARSAFTAGDPQARAALGNWRRPLLAVVPHVSRSRRLCAAR